MKIWISPYCGTTPVANAHLIEAREPLARVNAASYYEACADWERRELLRADGIIIRYVEGGPGEWLADAVAEGWITSWRRWVADGISTESQEPQ